MDENFRVILFMNDNFPIIFIIPPISMLLAQRNGEMYGKYANNPHQLKVHYG